MIHHDVDPTERGIDSDDLACWLLFFSSRTAPRSR